MDHVLSRPVAPAETGCSPKCSPISLAPGAGDGLSGTVLQLADRLLGLDRLARVYAQAIEQRGTGFSDAVLNALGVTFDLDAVDLERIPCVGPLVVVANHPFGGIDGLMLDALMQRVRPDVKLLANHLLARIPEFAERMIAVDPFGGESARRRNGTPLRDAVRHVKCGGALVVFPAGEVAHLTWRMNGVQESAWSPTIARLISRTRATVIPAHFEGRNSALFQVAGMMHSRLRTLLLPRELLNKRGHTIRVQIGPAIDAEQLDKFGSSGAAVAHLRERTLTIGARDAYAAIEPASPHDALVEEIKALPAERCLLESGDCDVYCCPASEIPLALREIGRLREITFRRVGEGTGRSLDIDRFDGEYLHLFVWQRSRGQIVGAYRLGLTDEIVQRAGIRGLYTHTLFRFDRRLLDQLEPSIELGRSFVIEEHQRSYAALLLLWRGIGKFIAMRPRYRILFGAVSISADYDSTTKRLLMTFLRTHYFDCHLSRLAQPRHPSADDVSRRRYRGVNATVVEDIDQVDILVRKLEHGARGVPVLIRQYLRLGARLLGFNVDPEFSNVVDGLFYVDLARVDLSLLSRYMGTAEARAFLNCHCQDHAPEASRRGVARLEADPKAALPRA